MKNLFPKLSSVVWRSTLPIAALELVLTCSAIPATVTYDFDTGIPALATGQNIPLDQTADGVTAHFSALAGGFSIQTDERTGLSLSQFSGHYLYHNVAGSVLEIRFSQPATNLSFTFATSDFPPIEIPTPIVLAAYTNSTATPPMGSVTNRAAYGTDTLPMGALTFNSAQAFDLVTISIQPGGGMGFLLDNLTVAVTGGNMYTIATSASPGTGGTTSGGGIYTSGASVAVVAAPYPGYEFVNWMEEGVPVSPSPSFTFSANANRNLVALFAPRLQVALSPDSSPVVSWPAPSPGYVLQEKTDCGTTNWVDTTNTVQVAGGQKQVLVSPMTGICFYRLFHP